MNVLRLFLLALVFSTLAGCASKSKGSSRMYEGDTSPNLRMYEETPGGPLGR